MEAVVCRKCLVPKTAADFYPGRVRCKACVCKDVRQHRHANIEAIRAYDRERGTQPHRIANTIRVTRNWRRAHPNRTAAHNAVARAELTAPPLCEGCGAAVRLEKHHHDYTKPLVVMWLCKPCHTIADKIRRLFEQQEHI